MIDRDKDLFSGILRQAGEFIDWQAVFGGIFSQITNAYVKNGILYVIINDPANRYLIMGKKDEFLHKLSIVGKEAKDIRVIVRGQ